MITEKIGRATIHNMDCIDFLKGCEDNQFDLAIVDPPFPVNTSGGGKIRTLMRKKDWDNSIPDIYYFNELKRVSKNFIMFGANFFTQYLEPNNKWIIWHKNHSGDKVGFSEVELVYSTIGKNTRLYKEFIIGKSLKWHACPKPIKLYEWLLKNYAKDGDSILDTHMGSGSIAIATNKHGFDLTACELDKDYFQSACERIKQAYNQPDMFTPIETKPEQTKLI